MFKQRELIELQERSFQGTEISEPNCPSHSAFADLVITWRNRKASLNALILTEVPSAPTKIQILKDISLLVLRELTPITIRCVRQFVSTPWFNSQGALAARNICSLWNKSLVSNWACNLKHCHTPVSQLTLRIISKAFSTSVPSV